ncbi:MAG: anthranilate phosphoribosyltransferase, partial [Oscillospiraceae bacterium]|nr:anthranilate phosphoribosyltransferase [Oscillospiraceae bacterium]
ITPEDFGLERRPQEDIVGGTPEENATITLAVLNGVRGAKRDAVLLNAGAGLYVAGKAAALKDGVTFAAELIDSGRAKEKLEAFVRESNRREGGT